MWGTPFSMSEMSVLVPAHVEGDQLRFPEQLTDVSGGADASRRAGQNGADGHAAGVVDGSHRRRWTA